MPLLDVINPYVDGALTHVGVNDESPTVSTGSGDTAAEGGHE
jgi:hypothetical protein